MKALSREVLRLVSQPGAADAIRNVVSPPDRTKSGAQGEPKTTFTTKTGEYRIIELRPTR